MHILRCSQSINQSINQFLWWPKQLLPPLESVTVTQLDNSYSTVRHLGRTAEIDDVSVGAGRSDDNHAVTAAVNRTKLNTSNLSGRLRSPCRLSTSRCGTGYHLKLSFQLNPPHVMSEPVMYSNVSSLITSMIGDTTERLHTPTKTTDTVTV